MKKLYGFTLSEVLITLGVIGVVAAMTIPSIIANYQKQVWVNQLKASYSIINQGLLLMQNGEDITLDLVGRYFLGVPLSKSCPSNYVSCSIRGSKLNCSLLNKYFKGKCELINTSYVTYYLKKEKSENEAIDSVFTLSNGTDIISSGTYTVKSINNSKGVIGPFYIDVNGYNKKPNTFGRDIFVFYISEVTGQLVPVGAQQLWYYWKTTNDYRGTCDMSKPNTHLGVGCTARVIDEGWQMKY